MNEHNQNRDLENLSNRIYDILVAHAGAYDDKGGCVRIQFRYFMESEGKEFRFQGRLGFGGKFRKDGGWNGNVWHVTCYSEDETPERRRIIEQTNEALADLRSDVDTI